MADDNAKVTSIMSSVSGWQSWFCIWLAIKKYYVQIYCAAIATNPAGYWTSGANEGDLCDVRHLYINWCAVGTRVKRQDISMPWADGNPSAEVEQRRCLSLNMTAL